MKLSAIESVKFKKLKLRLQLSQWQAVGLLESIWMFAARNAPIGNIGKHSNEDIAVQIEWAGNPDDLVSALVDCRWLDVDETHRLIIHDWADHLPNWLQANLKRHGKEVAIAEPTKQPTVQVTKQPTVQPASQPTVQPTIPSSQVHPSQVKPLPDEQPSELGDVSKLTPEQIETMEGYLASVSTRPTMLAGESPEFKAWYESYPVKASRGKAWKAYQMAVAVAFRKAIDDETFMTEREVHAMLIAGARRYAESPVGMVKPPPGAVKDYRIEPHNWLEAQSWLDPPEKLLYGGNLSASNRPPPNPNEQKPLSKLDEYIKSRKEQGG